jgi:hypothetical protein
MLKRTLKEVTERNGDHEVINELRKRIDDLRLEIHYVIQAMKSKDSLSGHIPEKNLLKEYCAPHEFSRTIEVSNKPYKLMGEIDEDMDFMRNNMYKASFDDKFKIKPFAVRRISQGIDGEHKKKLFVEVMNRFLEVDGKIVTLSYLFENMVGENCGDAVVERLNKSLETVTTEVYTNIKLIDFNEEPLSYGNDKVNVIYLGFEYEEHKFLSHTEDEAASKEGESKGKQEGGQQETGCTQG